MEEEKNNSANNSSSSTSELENSLKSLNTSDTINSEVNTMTPVDGSTTPVYLGLSEVLSPLRELYSCLYLGDLRTLMANNDLLFEESEKIRCIGFQEPHLEINEKTQKFFQYQVFNLDEDEDILSITKQFEQLSQLILGRTSEQPVVIQDSCYGLILAAIYFIKYELFSLPQAQDLIGYNDFFGTSKKHSHFDKVDSCTLINDITTYYYNNMTKRKVATSSGNLSQLSTATTTTSTTATTTTPEQVSDQKSNNNNSLTSPPTKPKGHVGLLKKIFKAKDKKEKDKKEKKNKKDKEKDKHQDADNEKPHSEEILELSHENIPPEDLLKHHLKQVQMIQQQQIQEQKLEKEAGSNGLLEEVENYDDGSERSKNLKTIIAPTFEKLPDEYKTMVKTWDVKQEAIDQHFEIILSLLHFHTKQRFYTKEPNHHDKPKYYNIGKVCGTPAVSPDTTSSSNDQVVSYSAFQKKPLDQICKRAGDIKKLYTVKEKVGKGGFGTVFLARSNTDKSKQRLAIKKLPHVKKKERKFNIKEIRVLEFCKHPNIITFYSSHMLHNEVWIAMEFMEGGTLAEASSQYPFQESNIAYVAREVLQGLAYLHSIQLVHRDLKSQNIMMTTSGEIKLIDFGLCANLSKGERIRMCGSPIWMPPEMIQQKPHGFTCDIWSLGVCLLDLANRNHRLRKNPIKTMFMVGSEGMKDPFEDPNRWSDTFHDLIGKCLQIDPHKRPSAQELLKHPFIELADNKKKMGKILSSIFLKTIVGIVLSLFLSYEAGGNVLVNGKKINKIPIKRDHDDSRNGMIINKDDFSASSFLNLTSGSENDNSNSNSTNSSSHNNSSSETSDSSKDHPSDSGSHDNSSSTHDSSEGSHNDSSHPDDSGSHHHNNSSSHDNSSSEGSHHNSGDSGSASSKDGSNSDNGSEGSKDQSSSSSGSSSSDHESSSSSSDDLKCQACEKGFFANKTEEFCRDCETGSCEDKDKYCTKCPVGYFGNTSGLAECHHCTPGYYTNNSGSVECTVCADGWVAPSNGSAICLPCDSGTTSDEDHIECKACEAGSYSYTGSPCEECAPGSYSLQASPFCSFCTPGTYNTYGGQASCVECNMGFFNPSSGSSSIDSCIRCPDGSYCPSSGLSQPLPCPEDKYCISGAINPIPCRVFYSSGLGSKECTPNRWLYIVIFGSVGVVLVIVVSIWRYVQVQKYNKLRNISEVSRLIPKPSDGPEYGGF
ncbi:hypothetical protein DICPUDRAFT_148117 [Dictyostelium purpureum]|uniref:non-specific serine/threonine protein kinase n=1 Tax=Dictyostelium purpureum TaxID=5786 RepID=F0ZAA7_DICPU|nr:uncharacterized protein DICPUDRAFT_148117 [Dictyostelium purpureum]EGC39115.1 hypothetical protein DICPUDRAFT_148117 [Dictyostelium purpureum]|eukprot:XP_003284367.1 hypothetical protein DICPUDRAFT_148117 [Dictyostelium purpureum]